jgi:hypothetical protein
MTDKAITVSALLLDLAARLTSTTLTNQLASVGLALALLLRSIACITRLRLCAFFLLDCQLSKAYVCAGFPMDESLLLGKLNV